MGNAKGNAPPSIPTSCLQIAIPGFVAMYGRSGGMQLTEHEHPEIQIAIYFRNANSRVPIAPDALPEYFSLIPSGKLHCSSRGEGAEVIVLHLGPKELDQGADELLRKPPAPFRPLDLAVDPVIHSMGGALRRGFLLSKVPDRLFVEAVGTVLVGHLLRQQSFRWSERSIKGKLSQQSLRDTLDLIESRLAGELTVQLSRATYQWECTNLRASSGTPLGRALIITSSNGELNGLRISFNRLKWRRRTLRWNWDFQVRVISPLCFGSTRGALRKSTGD